MSDVAVLGVTPADLAPGRPYVERDEVEAPWYDRLAVGLWSRLPLTLRRLLGANVQAGSRYQRELALAIEEAAGLSDQVLCSQARALGSRLRREGFLPAPSARCFALIGEAAHRVLGQRPYPTQYRAAWSLLQGTLVEMATGEGKTFAATLPAIAVALARVPVHVVTVNDYLASRDAQTMRPLYAFFGLRVGVIVNGLQKGERRTAYSADVTYASNKELAFDYLRDRATLGERASGLHLSLEQLRDVHRPLAGPEAGVVMRGLAYCIVDEADSVFVDEARTPLILSTQPKHAPAAADYERALGLAAAMDPQAHYNVDERTRRVRLKPAAYEWLDAAVEPALETEDDAETSVWASARAREELVQQALAASLLYLRDRHYVLTDGKVQIVDEATGRVMPDRAWERGLHQMIEAKEGVVLTGQRETLARITYQRLFRRYVRLAGMTGTALEVASEIRRVYGLDVVRVPLHRRSQRLVGPARCYADAAAKWHAVAVAARRQAVKRQRPVLIGTRSVQASEQISAVLREHGIEHVVLNAKQDQDEAAIVAQAGQAGRVTVATNMAGRGTDIVLGPGVVQAGGLHVILTEFHESRRIDRQLIGRCGRQGDPGTAQALVALDDELFVAQLPVFSKWLAARSRVRRSGVPRWLLAGLRWLAQRRAEAHQGEVRLMTLQHDQQLAQLLSFSGRGE